MKKSKLIFSAFILALTLLSTSVAVTSAYADSTDPQGAVTTTKAPPPPPPPPPPSNGGSTFAAIWAVIVEMLS